MKARAACHRVGSPLMRFGKFVHQVLVVAGVKFRSELSFCFNCASFEMEPGVASAPIRYQLTLHGELLRHCRALSRLRAELSGF